MFSFLGWEPAKSGIWKVRGAEDASLAPVTEELQRDPVQKTAKGRTVNPFPRAVGTRVLALGSPRSRLASGQGLSLVMAGPGGGQAGWTQTSAVWYRVRGADRFSWESQSALAAILACSEGTPSRPAASRSSGGFSVEQGSGAPRGLLTQVLAQLFSGRYTLGAP